MKEIVAFVRSRQGQLTSSIDGRQYEIAVGDILYVESVDNRTFLYTAKQTFETKQRVYELEEALKKKGFLRISKAALVNLMKITSIRPALNGRFFNLATFVLGSAYRPEERFGYDAFLTPLLYAFLGILPMCVMYSKKEMTPRQVLIRKILQLVLLEVLLVGFVFGCAGLSGENGEQIAGFALAVFVVFVLVHVISFVLDTEQARRMTLDLLAYQAGQEQACDAPACEK